MNLDEETVAKLTSLVVFLARYGQNFERTLRFGPMQPGDNRDPDLLRADLSTFVLQKSRIVVVPIVKRSGESDSDEETNYDGYLLWENGDYSMEIRHERDEFQVSVIREVIRNSGYVTTFDQVVEICSNLDAGDFSGAMRILFASYNGIARSVQSLDKIVHSSATRSTISVLEQ
uniref:Uncharacterized protein n=1 Tax=viral metagenome TaxID=1070528 RepID=A0A6C0CHX8_9ZZZZ